MKRTSLVVAVLVLVFVSVLFVGLSFLPEVRATTRYVGGAGPGNHTTIQAAIDVADWGDTIYVHRGTYHEKVVVNKSISLIGEDANETIVVGNGDGDVIQVTANRTTISGFTVTNGTVGIELDYVENCSIEGNVLRSNSYGLSIYYSNRTAVTGNSMFFNGMGVIFHQARYNNLTDNIISSNYIGIWVGVSRDNIVSRNLISSHYQYGIWLYFRGHHKIVHNAFVGNAGQAQDDWGEAEWDDGYPAGGNYWSDYDGIDEMGGPDQNLPGSDGIGDEPYTFLWSGTDAYPLMSPPIAIPPGPRSPQVLDVSLTGDASENVRIEWSLSEDDGGGNGSVIGYEVYRNTTYKSEGAGYQLAARLSNESSSYVDLLAGEGDSNNYFYRVCAKDLYGSAACSQNQAAKFTRPLFPGPNLVSVPLIQSDESIETVLQTVTYDRVWFHNSSSQEWIWYMTTKTYRRGLWNMDHTDGMWVNVTGDCNLTVAGVVPAQTTIHLYKGWNLVSFPSFNTSYSVSNLKGEIGAKRVEGYDSTPPYHLRALGDAEVLRAGDAYWVNVDADTVWTIEAA